ncbi:MAG: phosphoribosyltransferase [Geodermatophilaceae bacterium]
MTIGRPAANRPAPGCPASLELLLPRACVGCGCGRALRWCPDCLDVEFDPVLHRPDPCPPGLPTAGRGRDLLGQRALRRAGRQGAGPPRTRPLRWARCWPPRSDCLITQSQVGPGQLSGPAVAGPGTGQSLRRRRERGRDHVSDWTRWTVRWLRAVQHRGAQCPSVAADHQQAWTRSGSTPLRGRPTSAEPSRWDRSARHHRARSSSMVDDIVTTGATLVAAARVLDHRPRS